uniref:Uncharacterized protein n=1 Tax=Arion vulgaris TaxID=1028688 RepID=A0A0B7AIQ5_9EUPU
MCMRCLSPVVRIQCQCSDIPTVPTVQRPKHRHDSQATTDKYHISSNSVINVKHGP